MSDEKKEKKHNKNEELESLKNEIASLKEEVLRGKADIINYRKRKDEEVSNYLKYANEDILNQLLLILDNFERAISSSNKNLDEEEKKYFEGFIMIYESIKEIVKNSGVFEIELKNNKFDPNIATCIFTEEDTTKEEDTILEVFKKGYMYKDKVLRYASVKVNKLNENKEKEDDKNE